LISEAPVLLLDEATSALDSESESRIQQALAGLAGQRTIIVVAHRLATVRRADTIFVIEDGVATESGSHDDLLATGEAYARMVQQQLT
jgi:ABC-type multidrug transport system fused ATPase/permease subunit